MRFLYFRWYVFGLPLQRYHKSVENHGPTPPAGSALPFIGTWTSLPLVPLLRSIWIPPQQVSVMQGFVLEGILGWSVLRVPRAQAVPAPSSLTSRFATTGACKAPT